MRVGVDQVDSSYVQELIGAFVGQRPSGEPTCDPRDGRDPVMCGRGPPTRQLQLVERETGAVHRT